MNAMFAQFSPALADLLAPILSLAFGAARMLGVLTVLPIFTRLGLTGILRGGVALALAIPLLPGLLPMLRGQTVFGPELLLLLAKEAALGVIIGLLFSVPFWAAEAAGEYMDQQRGSQAAVYSDASGTNQTGITGTLLTLTLITTFFAIGGMRYLLEALAQSFVIWPPLQALPNFAPDGPLRLLGLLDQVMRGGLTLAGPMVVALVLTELSLGLVGKFAPQLHVFDLALSIKGIVFVVGLPVYAVFLIGYLNSGLTPLVGIVQEIRQFAG